MNYNKELAHFLAEHLEDRFYYVLDQIAPGALEREILKFLNERSEK